MKTKFLYLTMLFSWVLSAQVGINTITPDASSALDIVSSEGGILIPRMTEFERDLIASPATGLMIFQTDNTSGFYYYNGTIWTTIAPSGGGVGEFQSISGIVQNTTAVGSDDFVFGDTDLDGSGSKFYFDTSKGAFRAGQIFGTEWDDANVGFQSIVLGTGTASGTLSFAAIAGNASGNAAVSFQGSSS
ncbi:hypothetical protein RM538_09920, partial [Constantimarinum sp. W242]|nr:hypothetical protein [Constantimarinum sp. W242]